MLQKTLSRALFLAISLAAASAPLTARADWATGTVRQLNQSRHSYDSGRTRIYLEGATCAATGGHFFIADDSSNREQMIQVLLAAFLSGRTVGLGHTPATCDVYSVSIQ